MCPALVGSPFNSLNEVASASLSFDVANSPDQPPTTRATSFNQSNCALNLFACREINITPSEDFLLYFSNVNVSYINVSVTSVFQLYGVTDCFQSWFPFRCLHPGSYPYFCTREITMRSIWKYHLNLKSLKCENSLKYYKSRKMLRKLKNQWFSLR